MNGKVLIKVKQKEWARHNRKVTDIGYQYYTNAIDSNIYNHLSEKTESEFKNADGNELKDMSNRPAKMKALYSSSALAVNIFQYWREGNRKVTDIASACGFCNKKNTQNMQIEFECKFTIKAQREHHPNIDVLIKVSDSNSNQVFAIESKMTEPFDSSHSNLSNEYLVVDTLWQDFPSLKTLATGTYDFKYLDYAQLIKHILGLMNQYGDKKKFVLMYLYYDVAGKDGVEHFNEIEKFKTYAEGDGVDFRTLSYQELIAKVYQDFYNGNEEYCNYIVDRYL